MPRTRRVAPAARHVVATLTLIAGCGGQAGATDGGTGPVEGSPMAAGVVSVVGGRQIRREELSAAVQRSRLPAREVLDRLQERELLAAAAEQAGYGERVEVRRAVERAAVRVVLRRLVADTVSADSITQEELRASYERAIDRYRIPERRASTQLLVPVASGAPAGQWRAAEEVAQRALAALRSSEAPGALLDRWKHDPFEGRAELRVEDDPPFGRGDSVEPAYLDALFELRAPGLVLHPVRTSYGAHVVLLTEVHPAQETPFSEASEELRRELLDARRQEALQRLLETLAARARVVRHEEATRRALGRDFGDDTEDG